MMQITHAFEKEPVINEALPQTNVTDCGNFEQTGLRWKSWTVSG